MKIIELETYGEHTVSIVKGDVVVYQHSLTENTQYEVPEILLSVISKDFGERVFNAYMSELHNENNKNYFEGFIEMALLNTSTALSAKVLKLAANKDERWVIDYLEILGWYQYDVAESKIYETIATEIYGITHKNYEAMYSDLRSTLTVKKSKYSSLIFFYVDDILISTSDLYEDDIVIPDEVVDYLDGLNKYERETHFEQLYYFIKNSNNYMEDSESAIDIYYKLLPPEKAELLLLFIKDRYLQTEVENEKQKSSQVRLFN